jgi:hypothetical protein
VDERNRTHTCEAWVISSFKKAVREYIKDARVYADELKKYVSDAGEYAKCELRSLRPPEY